MRTLLAIALLEARARDETRFRLQHLRETRERLPR